jgi:hypothetical protein
MFPFGKHVAGRPPTPASISAVAVAVLHTAASPRVSASQLVFLVLAGSNTLKSWYVEHRPDVSTTAQTTHNWSTYRIPPSPVASPHTSLVNLMFLYLVGSIRLVIRCMEHRADASAHRLLTRILPKY